MESNPQSSLIMHHQKPRVYLTNLDLLPYRDIHGVNPTKYITFKSREEASAVLTSVKTEGKVRTEYCAQVQLTDID